MSEATGSDVAALTALRETLGGIVSAEAEVLRRASFDAMKMAFEPTAVVKPVEEAQIGVLLRLANEFGVPVTTRGAGSSLTGSAAPLRGGWVLDLSEFAGFSIDAEERTCSARPGSTSGWSRSRPAPVTGWRNSGPEWPAISVRSQPVRARS